MAGKSGASSGIARRIIEGMCRLWWQWNRLVALTWLCITLAGKLVQYFIHTLPRHFGELKRLMAGIGEKVLIQQLRSMSVTEVGIATRHDRRYRLEWNTGVRQLPSRILARDRIAFAMSASGRKLPFKSM